ncbi:oligosaccharide flippase family protein [Enterococcus casseliflavus]|uniref:oligosaccharide flippase family protein n=1 Tax=Enterococcus casseliflavus TaxID=37734 RepID=UPI003D14C91A
MKKFFSNFIYQSIFQFTKLLIPIITVPIVSHALGPEKIGVYNYTQSITQYFVLFAGLGLAIYGQKTIAQSRDNKDVLSKVFWELEFLSIGVGIVVLTLYLIFSFFSTYRTMYLIQSLTIMAVLIDISWFFIGIEDFKKTSLRSLFISIATMIAIVIFVNNESDIYLYVFIQSFGSFLSAFIMWGFLLKKIHYSKPKVTHILRHFKFINQYFLSVAALYLYTNMNKTLLGLLSSKNSVAYFSSSMVIITVCLTLISTADNVLLPKLSYMSLNKKKEDTMLILEKSLNYQLYFTIPLFFGIILISDNMVPWFFGTEFLAVSQIMKYLSILVIINTLGSSIGKQYLIPNNEMKIYNQTLILGSFVGIILNILMIPILGINGAVISTIISEVLVTFFRVALFLKRTGFKYRFKNVFFYFLSSLIMFVSVSLLTRNFEANVITTFFEVTMGFSIYFCITSIFKINPIINETKVLKRKYYK